MGVQINEAQFTAIERDHAQNTGAEEPCHDCECDCKKSKGRWTDGPGFRVKGASMGLPNGASVKYLSSGIPIGVNAHVPVSMTIEFYGKIECRCPDKEQCKRETQWTLQVDGSVAIPINVAGFALNAIPNKLYRAVAKWAYRAITWGDSAAKAGEALSRNADLVRNGLMPALYTLRDSADLICEGRFDHEQFKRHVADILTQMKLEPMDGETE